MGQDRRETFLNAVIGIVPNIDILLKINEILSISGEDGEAAEVVRNEIMRQSREIINIISAACLASTDEENDGSSSFSDIKDNANSSAKQGVSAVQAIPVCKMCNNQSDTLRKATPNVQRYLLSQGSVYAREPICRDCRVGLAKFAKPLPKMQKQQATPTFVTSNSDFGIVNDVGLLGSHGYRVGKSGIWAQSERVKILNSILSAKGPTSYSFKLKGGSNSNARFKQIERAIKYQINSKDTRTDKDFELALDHWASDLEAFQRSHRQLARGTHR